MKILCTTCFLVILFIACPKCVRPQTPGPTLLTEEASARAAAIDSVTLVRDPLPVVNRRNMSTDSRTRLTLFAINLDLLPGEDASAVTARARDSRSRTHIWSDTFQVPVLAAHPVPTREPDVLAVVGHMYVVHTKDPQTDLYALFRVEALDPGKSVTISWKSVPTPEGN